MITPSLLTAIQQNNFSNNILLARIKSLKFCYEKHLPSPETKTSAINCKGILDKLASLEPLTIDPPNHSFYNLINHIRREKERQEQKRL